MKTLTATIFLITGMLMHAWAEPAKDKIVSVKIAISYKGVNAKWFSSLDEKTISSIRKKDETVELPVLMVKPGLQSSVHIIQEYRLDASSSEGPVVPCGIIVDLTPELDGDGIRISGTSVLRYSTNKSAIGVATRFKAQENLIGVKLEDGTTKAIHIEGGGQMMITATLLDGAGSPIKK